jgi:hypothetical protein
VRRFTGIATQQTYIWALRWWSIAPYAWFSLRSPIRQAVLSSVLVGATPGYVAPQALHRAEISALSRQVRDRLNVWFHLMTSQNAEVQSILVYSCRSLRIQQDA